METLLIRAIDWFTDLLIFILFMRAIFSWFAQGNTGIVGSIYRLLVNLSEPVVEPVRRFMSRFNTGMFDFSLVVAMILIEIVSVLLINIVRIIF